MFWQSRKNIFYNPILEGQKWKFLQKEFFFSKSGWRKKNLSIDQFFFFAPHFQRIIFQTKKFFFSFFFASTSIQTLLPLLNKILFWLSREGFLRFPPFSLSLSLSLSLSNICSTSLLLTHLCSISIHTHTGVPSYSLPTQTSCLATSSFLHSRALSHAFVLIVSLSLLSLSHTHAFFFLKVRIVLKYSAILLLFRPILQTLALTRFYHFQSASFKSK